MPTDTKRRGKTPRKWKPPVNRFAQRALEAKKQHVESSESECQPPASIVGACNELLDTETVVAMPTTHRNGSSATRTLSASSIPNDKPNWHPMRPELLKGELLCCRMNSKMCRKAIHTRQGGIRVPRKQRITFELPRHRKTQGPPLLLLTAPA